MSNIIRKWKIQKEVGWQEKAIQEYSSTMLLQDLLREFCFAVRATGQNVEFHGVYTLQEILSLLAN